MTMLLPMYKVSTTKVSTLENPNLDTDVTKLGQMGEKKFGAACFLAGGWGGERELRTWWKEDQ